MMGKTALTFEQGPIRPPSEAGSLLIRATRNCPWNKCAFCATYKRRKFSRRDLNEIKRDIDTIKNIADEITGLSWSKGDAGRLTQSVLSDIYYNPAYNDNYRSVALWIASGAETVFLQDANSIMLSTTTLIELVNYIKQVFPQVNRITSYARANSLVSKSEEEFALLKNAGLSRLHVGMESGSDTVLKLIDKGVRADHLIEGGRRVVAAGISLCLYIIPGIGGLTYSEENARESARVVNLINPNHVRFRSLYVKDGTPLAEMVENGVFIPPNEDDVVKEIRLFISLLNGIQTKLVSDHILNLLEEIEGKLPEEKDHLLSIIDNYLAMNDTERLLFQLGRRAGALRRVEDLKHPQLQRKLKEAKAQIDAQFVGGIPEYLSIMKRQFV